MSRFWKNNAIAIATIWLLASTPVRSIDLFPGSDVIWIGGIVLGFFALAGLVFVLERAKNKHQTVAQVVSEERDELKAKLDKLTSKSAAAVGDVTVAVKADMSTLNADLEKAGKAIAAFRENAVAHFDVVQHAAAMTPAVIVPTTLGAVYIDRDDLMKSIGVNFPQPVLLDDAPIHNGLGEPLNYWTWPKGIRNEKPPTVLVGASAVPAITK